MKSACFGSCVYFTYCQYKLYLVSEYFEFSIFIFIFICNATHIFETHVYKHFSGLSEQITWLQKENYLSIHSKIVYFLLITA